MDFFKKWWFIRKMQKRTKLQPFFIISPIFPAYTDIERDSRNGMTMKEKGDNNLMRTTPYRVDTTDIYAMQEVAPDRPLRFLLYCHDTYGLGHLRRTLSLAEYFTRALARSEVLIVTGAPLAHAFTLPPHVDYIKLPAVTKLCNGKYAARNLTADFTTVRDLRATLLRETALAYKPDVFLVDHAPQGMAGEVLPTLFLLQAAMPHCLRVLGLRDIVDSGADVRHTWAQEGVYHTLEYDYDLILVYGTQRFYDIGHEYRLPSSLLPSIKYCGYLDRISPQDMAKQPEQTSSVANASAQPLIVVTAGGGGDGFPLLSTYLRGLQQMPECLFKSILVTGPLMREDEQQTLQNLAASLPTELVQLKTFIPNSISLFRSADLVVSMAGYNTVVELLELRQRMLLVPRTTPRLEQYERATRLAAAGLAQMIPPDALTPAHLMQCIQQRLHMPSPHTAQFTMAGITFQGQQMALQAILEAKAELSDPILHIEEYSTTALFPVS